MENWPEIAELPLDQEDILSFDVAHGVHEQRASYNSQERRGFRDLRVWQMSAELAVECYALTAEYPQEERYGLVSQIRRAVISISSNIAEGWGKDTYGDFDRGLSIAAGSLREVDSQIHVSERLGFCSSPQVQRATAGIEPLAKSLYKL